MNNRSPTHKHPFTPSHIYGLCALLFLLTTPLVSSSEAQQNPPTLKPETAGLKLLPIKAIDGRLSLPFKLVAEARCFFADRDAIGLELTRSAPGTKLLLSVEPLKGTTSSRTPVVKDVISAGLKLEEGFDVTLEIPAIPSPDALGVFICKDSNGDGHCSSKPVIPIQQVLDKYNSLTSSLPKDYKATDKIYFFKPLIVTAEGVLVPVQQMSKERYLRLEQFLLALFGLNSTTSAVSKQFDELGRILESKAFQVVADTIILRLPGFVPQRCGRPPGSSPLTPGPRTLPR
jgi:hypothetical protein